MVIHVLPKPLKHGGSLIANTVVFHATAGSSLSGALSALRAAKLSYNFIIDRDGSVTKCIPLGRVARHAGSSYGPMEEGRGISRAQHENTAANRLLKRVYNFKAGCSVNSYSVGISFVNLNDGEDPITPAQWASALKLVAEIRKQHNIKWVTTHALVSPRRKSDPRTFELGRFAAESGVRAWGLG